MSRAKDLVAQMTLTEKAALLSGADFWRLKSIERLGLPTVMMSDGPHGLRKQADKSDNLGIGDSVPSVCFPPACTTAGSWDPQLLREIGKALGEECQAEEIGVLLGPGANIKRSPLCGRNFEYFSEDPFLTGRLAAALIDGVQSEGAGTSLKHFAANNQERARLVVNATVDERALREIYLAGFEYAVKTAHPRTVMCSYNKLDNVSLSANKRLLTDILRKEWGFDGLIVSDWGAVNDRVKGVQAGLDLEMPGSGGVRDAKIVAAVRAGKLPEEAVDACAERVVELILQCTENQKSGAVYDKAAHHQLARKAAAAGTVLLKNEHNILPLAPGARVAVVGGFAKVPRYQGAGSSRIHPTEVTTPLQALQDAGLQVEYAEGFAPREKAPDKEKIAAAVSLCRGVETAIVFAGLPEACESEGWDRNTLDMPAAHNALIEAVAAVCPRVIVVLQCGSPILLPWQNKVQGIVLAYLGGQAGGEAVADILLGHVNPSGHLAETWPLAEADTPTHLHFPGGTRSVEYRESLFVGYRYYDTVQKAVAYPFGYGLSYTTFRLHSLRIPQNSYDGEGTLRVSARVQNTGTVAGACVAQLYIGRTDSAVMRPEKELKGFVRVELAPGEEKEITFELDRRSFAYYNAEAACWALEGGDYTLYLAQDSRTVCDCAHIAVQGDGKEALVTANRTHCPTYFALPQGALRIGTDEFETLYGKPLPPLEHIHGEAFGPDTCLADLQHLLKGRIISAVARHIIVKNCRGDSLEDMQNMAMASMMHTPLRNLVAMGGGKVTPDMVDGMADMLNGHYIRGWKKVRLLRKMARRSK